MSLLEANLDIPVPRRGRTSRTLFAGALLCAVLGCGRGGASVAPPDPTASDRSGSRPEVRSGPLKESAQPLTSESVKLK